MHRDSPIMNGLVINTSFNRAIQLIIDNTLCDPERHAYITGRVVCAYRQG